MSSSSTSGDGSESNDDRILTILRSMPTIPLDSLRVLALALNIPSKDVSLEANETALRLHIIRHLLTSIATTPMESESVVAVPESENPVALTVPETITLHGVEVRLDATELDLFRRGITKLDSAIGRLTCLEVLRLNRNQLRTLPPEIGALTRLKVLHLDDNQLQTLPGEIGALTALEVVYLMDNQLDTLPSEIGALTRLKALYLDTNQLQTLPVEIGALTAVESYGALIVPVVDLLPRLVQLLVREVCQALRRVGLQVALECGDEFLRILLGAGGFDERGQLPFGKLALGRDHADDDGEYDTRHHDRPQRREPRAGPGCPLPGDRHGLRGWGGVQGRAGACSRARGCRSAYAGPRFGLAATAAGSGAATATLPAALVVSQLADQTTADGDVGADLSMADRAIRVREPGLRDFSHGEPRSGLARCFPFAIVRSGPASAYSFPRLSSIRASSLVTAA